MLCTVVRRSCFRPFSALFLPAFLLVAPASAEARNALSVSGVVVDEVGGAIAGARITASDANGAVVQSATADLNGAFSLSGLDPGTYTVVVEMYLFSRVTMRLTVPDSGSVPALRAVLRAGGFAESVVVTARRVETRLAETPQKIEVIDATDIERSVAADLTDVLKKNSGVDVVQYTGALSGVGIRGFRPQTSGINKRSLLLIDGRPSGVTNLATLLVDNVERIEVLKGAGSAIYGSSAMGGVINVITRQSRGKIGGNMRIGGGSFGTSEVAGRAGGNALPRLEFDGTMNVRNQRDDIRMGNGATRPATRYKIYDGGGRVGVPLEGGWRLNGSTDIYRGRDISTPPEIAAGTIGQGSKDIERSAGDARLTGRAGAHDLSFTGYTAAESSHSSNVTTSNALDLPYLPFLSFESELGWVGAQAKDAWSWSRRNSIVLGFDYEKVTSVTRSFTRTGEQSAPFSANNNKRTAGFYAENTLKLGNGRTVVAVGGRVDHITTETVATPLKTNFTPSETTFAVFNPSLGIKHELIKNLRGHFAIGRAFIPAEASMLTGFTTTVVSGRTQISQGNPDLKPERSTSFDVGAEWSSPITRFDVTAFRTVVTDRFISNVVVSNPAPPDPIILSVKNGLDAHISGLDMEVEQRLGSRVGVFANATHYFSRKERLTSGAEQDILNVAANTLRAGIDVDFTRLSTRVSGRYVQGRKDNDFTAPGFPIVDNDNFTVVDASATYRLVRQHAIVVSINNVFDAFYYEKLGYPLQGASFRLSYRLGF
jgi:vitamin B12 transporter